MKRFRLLILILSLVVGALSVSPASAHGFIVRAVPEDRAVLDRAPTRVQYWFSESLETEFSAINIRDQTGKIIASGGVDSDNHALMRVQLPPDLPDGAYLVELRPAFASDGHVSAESQVFFVGSEVGGIAGAASTTRAAPLEVIWRALLLASTLLVFGACTLYSGVLIPAWGNPEYRAGLLPRRVMNRLYGIVSIGLVIAFLSNILALLQQSMAFFDVGLSEVLSQSLWVVVRVGSRFGDVWNFRMFALGIAALLFGLSYAYRESQPDLTHAFWTANAWLLALIVGSFSIVSHAAGSLMLPWVGMALDWLHGTAAGFWVGGLAALVLVLPAALQPYDLEQRRLALLAVLRRFSRVAFAALLIVITTGIYSASTWLTAPSDLTQTSFGGALIFKLGLVTALLVVAALHHITTHPDRFERLARRFSALPFILTLRLEVIFAAGVLTAAALLSATPVPVPDYSQNQPPAPRASVEVQGYTVTQTLTPGGPGINTFDVLVRREGQPVDDLTVQTQEVYPGRSIQREWQPADPLGDGLYVSAGGGIDRAGAWWTLVNLTAPDGTLTRAAFAWEIRADAAVIVSQPPHLQNLLALALVSTVLLWLSLPVLRRLFTRLDMNPTTGTIAVFAILGTIVMLGFSTVAINNLAQQNEDALNPIPAKINTVLPDQASLDRGQTLFATACAAWESESAAADLQALGERLPALRDEAVFAITAEGWRSLPACQGDLTDAQRWDLVNTLRTRS